MSERSKRNRKLLLWRIAILALGYALPLGGLAFYFVLTGVGTRIAWVERERLGVRYIRQLAVVHDLAVQRIWAPPSARSSSDVKGALAKLDDLERELAPQLAALRLPGQPGSDLTAAQLRSNWEQAELDSGDHPEQASEIILFLGQIQAHLAQTADATGLNSSPDLETEYVVDAVAAALPVHVERLLQMHEQLIRLAPEERAMSEHLSAVFLRQLEKETPRLDRGLRLAIENDLHSEHVAVEFHRVFPAAAERFRQSLVRLGDELRADGNSAAYWDAAFARTYAESAQFWSLAIDQLDVLLADQIAYAKGERNTAIAIAALVLVTLLPLTWFYFRRYLRPLVQDLVNEVLENAEAVVKAKNQFLAMMSHEIRTPMNGVIGFAQLLADTRLTDEQRDYVRTILVSGESLLVVINDILDFSKLEAGRTELEKRPVSLRQLIEDVLELLATQARAKNLELVYWLDPAVPEGILGDGPRLRQILLNLVGNAVKFTAQGHVEVEVTVSPAAGSGRPGLAFHIRDTGIGIPPDRLDRLFKAFSQVDVTISRTFGGTGLGLAITQKLIELMGGRIAVTSTPGQGSDFHFTLPVEPVEVPVTARASAAPFDLNSILRDRSVLVVDDLEQNRRLVERFLIQHGAKVTLAVSAETALAALGRAAFDLAVLDYMMPEKDGLELAREIRSRHAALPLILLTSVPPEHAAQTAGLFDTVLLKPVRHQPFAAAAARALHREEPAPAVPVVAAPTPAFAAAHPLRIAVVDDNAVNRKVIDATLRSYGYAPVVFNDAPSALARLRDEAFDLVLMDVQMPGMDGLEATRSLRRGDAGELNRRTRVVALTAGAMAEERAACMDAGMDDFIAKPVSRAELLEKLAAVRPGKNG